MRQFNPLVFLGITLLTSCAGFNSYDSLVYYQPGYDSHYVPQLRTDGFYYTIKKAPTPGNPPKWLEPYTPPKEVDHYAPLYFYRDGSFAIGGLHPTLESLREWNTNRNAGYPCWGFYVISNNVVRMEWIDHATGMDSSIAERNTMEAHLDKNSLFLYSFRDRHGREQLTKPELYRFQVFDAKPAEHLNWLKMHPKYRITEKDEAQPAPKPYPR